MYSPNDTIQIKVNQNLFIQYKHVKIYVKGTNNLKQTLCTSRCLGPPKNTISGQIAELSYVRLKLSWA